ncbi:PepSY-associated TM helix domain-containing protein [Flavobacterium pedocola]
MKKNNLKKPIRKLHLWLGLSSGIVVFIVAITGCLYAFQQEIKDATEAYRFIKKQELPFLPPSQLQQIAKLELPEKHLHAIKYNGTAEAAEALFYNDEPHYYYAVYLNPYTGKVIKTVDLEKGFFPFILDGHFYLWLPHEIGQTVVATATLIFILMIISGFILWFPKNRKAAKQRFWFQWKEGLKWKRKNYDIHNITGFYVLSIALIFAVTGLVWGFPWFAYCYYKVIGGEKELQYQDPVSVKPKIFDPKTAHPMDKAWAMMQQEYPTAKSIEVHPPETDSSSIAANANPEKGTYWKIDYRYYDQYTLEEKQVNHLWGRFPKTDASDKLMRMNYDLHTGAVLGLPGKIFAFLISLLIASLPITGFLIWWGRKKKKASK